jgi:hypothetical protein
VRSQQWKHRERQIASRFGAARLPNNGFGQPDIPLPPGDIQPHPELFPFHVEASDTKTPRAGFDVESKSWGVVPKILYDALDQARTNARPPSMPVVIVSEGKAKPGKKVRRFALMDFEVFCALFAPREDETSGDDSDNS